MKRIIDGKLYDDCDAVQVLSPWYETITIQPDFGPLKITVKFQLFRRRTPAGDLDEVIKAIRPQTYGASTYDVATDDRRGEFFLARTIQPGDTGTIIPVDDYTARQLFEQHYAGGDWSIESEFTRFFGDLQPTNDLSAIKKIYEAGMEAQKKQQQDQPI